MSSSFRRSLLRPDRPLAQDVIADERELVENAERRLLLRGALSLGALTMLTGCDVTNKSAVQRVLTAISSWNDGVQAFLFSPTRLAPTFSAAEVRRPPRYNAVYPVEQVRRIDASGWKLELAGLIEDKRPWTLPQIYELPEVTQITRHICVEGWDYIGQWTGVPFRLFLERVGADRKAKYVAFRCADNYYGSIDMATALHPQTQLTTKYADEILPEPFGYPLRLRAATKLGFKLPKWITAIEVTNTYPGGWWEDRGYNWFSGI